MKKNQFALVHTHAPLFNTPDVRSYFGGADGKTLLLDEKGLLRCIETILYPESKVELLKETEFPFIWKVRTEEYPYAEDFFLDSRFFSISLNEPPERVKRLPSLEKIAERIPPLLGMRYIWGGNWPEGIAALCNLYPSPSPQWEDLWKLKGLDCSGLLYFLTDGYTPHRTSSLLHIGKGLPIAGKQIEEILPQLKPLDLIVWKGHVVIVLDQNRALESLHPHGVVTPNLQERFKEIFSTKLPIEDSSHCTENHFVIRRLFC